MDLFIQNHAKARRDHRWILKKFNTTRPVKNRIPAINEEGFFQYIRDRQAAGFLDTVQIEPDTAGEITLPAPITRHDAPTVERTGLTLTITAPTTNLNGGNTRVFVFVNSLVVFNQLRDLSVPAKRNINMSSWGLVGDEQVFIGLFSGGVAGWLTEVV